MYITRGLSSSQTNQSPSLLFTNLVANSSGSYNTPQDSSERRNHQARVRKAHIPVTPYTLPVSDQFQSDQSPPNTIIHHPLYQLLLTPSSPFTSPDPSPHIKTTRPPLHLTTSSHCADHTEHPTTNRPICQYSSIFARNSSDPHFPVTLPITHPIRQSQALIPPALHLILLFPTTTLPRHSHVSPTASVLPIFAQALSRRGQRKATSTKPSTHSARSI